MSTPVSRARGGSIPQLVHGRADHVAGDRALVDQTAHLHAEHGVKPARLEGDRDDMAVADISRRVRR